MVKHAKTAVEWSWWSDKAWVPYDAALTLKLENEFQEGNKKIACDKERFIDLNFSTIDEIRKQLHHSDERLIGLQRRFDDESRRRAVRRVVPEFFKDETFLVLGSCDNEEFVDNINLYGGLSVKKFVKKQVTSVIVDVATASSDDSIRSILQKANAASIPILKSEYIDAVISNHIASSGGSSGSSKVKKSDHDASSLASTTATTATASTATTKSSSKRKVDDISDQQQQSSSSSTATTTAKKSKTISGADYRTLINVGTVFDGSVSYADGEKYPFELSIVDIFVSAASNANDDDDDNNASLTTNRRATGNVVWATLDNAMTSWDILLSTDGAFEAKESLGDAKSFALSENGSCYSGRISSAGDLLMGTVVDGGAIGNTLSPKFSMVAKSGLGSLGASVSSSTTADATDVTLPTMIIDTSSSSTTTATTKTASTSTAATTATTTTTTTTNGKTSSRVASSKKPSATAAALLDGEYEGTLHLDIPFKLSIANGATSKLIYQIDDQHHISMNVQSSSKKAGEFTISKDDTQDAPTLDLPIELSGLQKSLDGDFKNGKFKLLKK